MASSVQRNLNAAQEAQIEEQIAAELLNLSRDVSMLTGWVQERNRLLRAYYVPLHFPVAPLQPQPQGLAIVPPPQQAQPLAAVVVPPVPPIPPPAADLQQLQQQVAQLQVQQYVLPFAVAQRIQQLFQANQAQAQGQAQQAEQLQQLQQQHQAAVQQIVMLFFAAANEIQQLLQANQAQAQGQAQQAEQLQQLLQANQAQQAEQLQQLQQDHQAAIAPLQQQIDGMPQQVQAQVAAARNQLEEQQQQHINQRVAAIRIELQQHAENRVDHELQVRLPDAIAAAIAPLRERIEEQQHGIQALELLPNQFAQLQNQYEQTGQLVQQLQERVNGIPNTIQEGVAIVTQQLIAQLEQFQANHGAQAGLLHQIQEQNRLSHQETTRRMMQIIRVLVLARNRIRQLEQGQQILAPSIVQLRQELNAVKTLLLLLFMQRRGQDAAPTHIEEINEDSSPQLEEDSDNDSDNDGLTTPSSSLIPFQNQPENRGSTRAGPSFWTLLHSFYPRTPPPWEQVPYPLSPPLTILSRPNNHRHDHTPQQQTQGRRNRGIPLFSESHHDVVQRGAPQTARKISQAFREAVRRLFP